MFGELLGAWAADVWMKLGQPERFVLAECGPGRGTLMADALRATAKLAGFHDAAQIHLIEMSEMLQQKQREALAGYDVSWHEELSGLPDNVPLILLANEFLDALPIRQFEFRDGRWQERVIGLGDGDALAFGLVPADGVDKAGQEGDMCETCPAALQVVQQICARLTQQGGAALLIDYGYTQGHGDTLQALKNHDYVDVLSHVGEADITAHVDFAALAAVDGAHVHGPVTQGAFLQRLGIAQRAAMLRQNATEEQAEAIDAALKRLTAPEEMGELFKVVAFSDGNVVPEGF